jgi:hypothetical protein
MIWFGNLNQVVVAPNHAGLGLASESTRMQLALERVAESAPGLSGTARVSALAATGWVDHATAERLLPLYRQFDPDRHFSEYVRRLSFRGKLAAEEFRVGVRCIVEEVTGSGWVDQVGPEPCVRFATQEFEGVVLAQPEVGFTINGKTREAIEAAVEEMPDVLAIVARNFERGAAEQLSGILHKTGVRGTLLTVNLLLGLRATALRYQPRLPRVVDVLSIGGAMKSADLAKLGERELAA